MSFPNKTSLINFTQAMRELTGIELEADQCRVFRASTKRLTASDWPELMIQWWNIGERCESPIEKLMAWAMLGEGLTFDCQVQLGDFTADFVIETQHVEIGILKPLRQPLLKVVIECDGHEFHSTIKRQARDRRIDRELQKAGYAVLRFTGSQINADPNHCAREVRNFIETRTA